MSKELQQLQVKITELETRLQKIERRLVEAPPPTIMDIQAMIKNLMDRSEVFRTSIRQEMQTQRQWISDELSTFREWLKTLDGRIRDLENRMDQRFQQVDQRFQQLEELIEQRFRWIVGFLITTLVSLLGLGFLNILFFLRNG